MAYHPLTRESGGNEASRITEAHHICRMLEEVTGAMRENERTFVEQMTDTDYCTVKQLFWLRDIKDKYL